MPRPKRPAFFTADATSRAEAVAELSAGVKRLLNLACDGQHDQDAPHFAQDVHRVVLLISEGAPRGAFHDWPLWAAVAVKNLRSIVRSGAGHLGRCRECENWFLVFDARRRICNRIACTRTAASRRAAASRRLERARQRRARASQ